MKSLSAALGMITVAAFIALCGVNPASATQDISTIELSDTQVASGMNNLGNEIAASATPSVLSIDAQNALFDDLVSTTVVHESAAAEPQSATAFDLPDVGTVVSVPLHGRSAGAGSALVGLFDERHVLTSTVELQFVLANDGGGSVQTWTDSSDHRSVSVSAEQVEKIKADSGLGAESAIGTNGFIDEMSACLASKEVPWAMLALVGGLCAIACGVTFGAACAVCLGAYFTGWGATITKCTVEVNQGVWR